MYFYNGIVFICLTIFAQVNAIENQQATTSAQSPVYHPSQSSRQLNNHIPVRLKVYGGNPNGPPKVLARYSPPLNSQRYYRPVLVPPIRRRYQISNGPAVPQMQQKRYTPTSHPPSSYNKMRRYPTKSYKYPIYYKKKSVPGNFNSNPELRKGYYQSQGPTLEPKISSNQGYHRVNSNKKNFYPSPHFDGKIIVKPNENKLGNGVVESGIGKTQYASSSSSHQYVNFPEQPDRYYQYKQSRERDPNLTHQEVYQSKRHYGEQNYPPKSYLNENNSPYNKYSSYSVYDDSNNEDEEDSDGSYVTESPVKYYVESTDPNTGHEAKKYLDFMSSSDYFLPKVSPDYHTKSIAYNSFNVPTSTEPILSKFNNDLYQNYKSQRINLGPGSSTGIRISSKISASNVNGAGNGINNSNNNENINNIDSIIVGHHGNNQYDNNQQQQQQNTFYRPSKKHQQIIHQHAPEKIEFTESDAIHSSYTSNPKEILEQSASSSTSLLGGGGGNNIASAVDDVKAKYGLSPKYKVSYQSAKIHHNHHYQHPQRVSVYQSDVHGKNNSNDDDDNDDDNDNVNEEDVDIDDDVNEK